MDFVGFERDKKRASNLRRAISPMNDSRRHHISGLHQLAGNRVVSQLVVQLQRRGAPAATLSRSQQLAAEISQHVNRGRFVEPQESMPEGVAGPPQSGGAFWLLNGLNPTDLADVLRDCGPTTRQQLLAHVAETTGRYDTPRLTAALRASSWGEVHAGVSGISLLDSIRAAQSGSPPTSFAAVWSQLAGGARPRVIETLRILPRDVLNTLQSRLSEAPASDRMMLSDVITDLLGTGTDMSSSDVIDLATVRGIDRTMASIYNLRGQMLQEQAAALGINTSAAAGIMKVESGGATFSDATNLSIVRFENHVLWNRWGATNPQAFNQHFDFLRPRGQNHADGHRFRASPTDSWAEFHGNQRAERNVLNFAIGLAGDVAYESASFGAGQIMGFNHAQVGFPSARAMAEQFDRSERAQISGIFDYIRVARLSGAINSGNYAAVAAGYNGSGQVATYSALMQDAADAYARVTRGKRHVIP